MKEMADTAPAARDNRRLLLGLGVVVLAVASAVVWWQGQPETASVFFRCGLLLGAVWWAYPSLRSVRWGVMLAVLGGAALLLTRWRLVALVVLGALVVALAWARIRKRGATR